MNFTKPAIIAFLALIHSAGAIAQETGQTDKRGYFDVGSTLIKVDGFGQPSVAFSGRLGGNFSSFLGAEIEAGIGLGDIAGNQTAISVDYYGAGFLVARAPVSRNVELFGRAGYAATDVSFRGFDLGSANGVAFGGGLKFNFGNTSLRADYTYADIVDGGHVVGITLGNRF